MSVHATRGRPPGRAGALAAAAALVVAALLAGCTDTSDEPTADPSPAPSASPGGPSGEATAEAPPRPEPGACYRLGYQQALEPVGSRDPVACKRRHTARTFAVADLPTLVDGHLVAVDSKRAREAPARECPKRLGRFLGGDREDLRLSMFRAVWFTPSLEEAEAGAAWFRCDVVALGGDEQLARLTGSLEGVLGRPAGSERYGMCGTAEPGTKGFERVACARQHSWRAVQVIGLAGLSGPKGGFPGVEAVRSRGQGPCEQAGSDQASDPLQFEWGYEWPTKQDWRSGTTWGYCWVPA